MPRTPILVSVDEAARLLGLSPYQVRQEHARGVLPGRRPGRFLRFTEADLAAYVERIVDDRGRGTASGLTHQSATRRRPEVIGRG